MNEHYQGRGVLYDDKGQPLDTVEYDFDLGVERGAVGSLHSASCDLSNFSVLRLRLDDHIRYLDVQVALVGFNRERKLSEYAIHVLPDQLNDMYNVVTFHRAQKGIYTAAA